MGEVWRLVKEMKRARTAAGREARGSIVMNTRWLKKLHDTRQPRAIEGDYRWKSHAMQPVRGWDRDKRWQRSLKGHAMMGTGPQRSTILIGNPNRGACQEKMFGVIAGEWRQELTVERWSIGRVPEDSYTLPNLRGKWDRRLMRHYFACPGRELGYRRVPVWRPDARVVQPTERQKWWWAIGREAWGQPCTGKCYKLFLPLCTRAELEDSLMALEWLKMVEALRRVRMVGPVRSLDEQVVAARYSPLFGPRRLVCGKCLGLHYGKVKNLQERWRADNKHVTGLGAGVRRMSRGGRGRRRPQWGSG